MAIKRLGIGRMQPIQEGKWQEARFSSGMITMLDPADIPTSAAELLKNATTRFDKTSRRAGSVAFGPAAPDTDPIMRLVTIKKENNDEYTVRFTPTNLYKLSGSSWTQLTDSNAMGETLAGTISDRIRTADVLDSLVFANNGVNEIQLVDSTFASFAKLGNAPKYRYVTGFYNRVVGAALRDVNEVEVGWSGDANISVWDSATDETAGKSPIIESTSDLSDHITGIFGFTNIMILLREKSIWLTTKQPIGTNPFYFYSAIAGLGCDAPYSATVIAPNSLAWLDRRTGTVWTYTPGGTPEPIGRPIEKTILEGLDDPKGIFGSYDPINSEYEICYPRVGSSLVSTWKYNLRNKSWTYNEIENLNIIEDVELATAGTTIDELIGTIDNLSFPDGSDITIDELSPSSASISTRARGLTDGTIEVVDSTAVDDNGVQFETEIVSKTFELPGSEVNITRIEIEYIQQVGGTFTLEYTRDGGINWILAKTITPVEINKRKTLKFRRVIHAKTFKFRLRGVDGLFDILYYGIWVSPSGEDKEDD